LLVLAILLYVVVQLCTPALFVLPRPAVLQSTVSNTYGRPHATNLRVRHSAAVGRTPSAYPTSLLVLGMGVAALVSVARRRRGKNVSRRAAVVEAAPPISATSAPLPRNPAVRVGRLSNGLQYVIQDHRDVGGQAVHATLEVHVGSRDESAGEQGMAHLVEHAAFMGCDRNRAALVAKGGQSNAETDYHHVSFETVIPNASGLGEALGLLRQAGFEAGLNKDVVERERLVVLREKAQMDTHDYAQECAALEALHSENVLGTQFPIGSSHLVQGWTVKQVKDFYKKWFSPANSTLFIVGDLAGRDEDVISKIEQTFGDVEVGVAPVRKPVHHIWSPKAPTIRIDPQSEESSVGRIMLMSKQPVHPLRTRLDMRRYVAEDIAIRAVASRLQRASRALEVPVVAEADCLDSIREGCRVTSIRVGGTTVDGAKRGVSQAARIVEDVCSSPSDEEEVMALGEDYVKGLADMKEASSAEQLQMLMDLLLLGHTPVAPADATKLAKETVREVTPAEVMEGARRVFGGLLDERLRVYATGRGWTESSILKAIDNGVREKGPRPQPLALHCHHLLGHQDASLLRVLDIDKNGEVYSTRLATGVKVRAVQSSGEPGNYRIRVRWPGGALKARSSAHAAVASHVLASHWQKADGSVDAFMKEHSLSEPVMGQSLEWTEISVSGAKGVDAALEFVKFVLQTQVEAGAEGSAHVAKALASLEALESGRELSIEREGLDRLVGSMYPHTDVLREPKGLGQVREVTRELSWGDDSLLEIDMVGGFSSPQEAFAAADKFFGASKMMEGEPKAEAAPTLPSVADSWTDAPQRVSMPKVANDRALVLLGGGMEKRPEWQVALLAEEILNAALFKRLREEARLTYDARGSFLVPDLPDTGTGHWTVAVHTDPADATQCAMEALRVVREQRMVDDSSLARAKAAVLGQLSQLQTANAFIMAMLDKRGGLERIQQVTPEEVEGVFKAMCAGPRSAHVVVAEGEARNLCLVHLSTIAPPKKKGAEAIVKSKAKAKGKAKSKARAKAAAIASAEVRSAAALAGALEERRPGTTVVVNENGQAKPRKGTFAVKVHGGKEVLALVAMPRPFKNLRELDMEEAATQVVEALNLMSTNPMNPINAFAFALLKELEPEHSSDYVTNTVVSPLSLFQTMAIAAYGAQEGKTLDGWLNVTHAEDLEQLCDISRDFSRSGGDRDVLLSSANAVWSPYLTESFIDNVKTNLNAEVFPEVPSKHLINAWVDRKTKGMIKNLLSDDPPDGATLVNAVHFKDQWRTAFMKTFTREADFSPRKDEPPVKVEMMVAASPYGDTRQKGFDYYVDDKVQVAEIPYVHDDYDALIALPAEGVSVDNFVARDFDTWCEGMQHNKEGSISFPKFKAEYGVRDMTNEFERMGLVLDGDYSKMGPGLRVGSVLHKAVMKVDEEGTEAAAASAMVMLTAMPIDPPFRMLCDRPFMFIVRHRPTNSIVFIAKIRNPTV
ncbi:hypothetical protein FOZ63_020655, partial [Perkinsus olseni]